MTKFMELMSFYSSYLEEIYGRNPELFGGSYATQMKALEEDAFSGGHLFTSAMEKHGYESLFAVVNCKQSQQTWAKEHGMIYGQSTREKIICAQIDHFCPDVLHIADPVAFNPVFLDNCNWKPRLVVAWRAAPIPDDVDWRNVDLMVSTLKVCRDKAIHSGARATETFLPAFPEFVAEEVTHIGKKCDVIFAGQIGYLHNKRQRFLEHLARVPEFQENKYSLRLHLANWTSMDLSEMEQYIQPTVWGMEMFRTLKSARIVVNNHIDMADNIASNMRIFETVGVGSFLLTEQCHELSEIFEPGVEVETYNSLSEMEDKIRFYLKHPEKREEIARKGQERCLKDHGLRKRSEELNDLIGKYLL
ncbi:glycosyltransferase family protein [Kiloniella sp.]|uniref:glycosyltransferase family protein n=1 Tax=Kiloniella sp. TaxID=1938587 RepID=UPI003A8CFC84